MAVEVFVFSLKFTQELSPTYTLPLARAGGPAVGEVVSPVQSGAHTFGVPEHLVAPLASNASMLKPGFDEAEQAVAQEDEP